MPLGMAIKPFNLSGGVEYDNEGITTPRLAANTVSAKEPDAAPVEGLTATVPTYKYTADVALTTER
jgi:hypothetical protein